MTQVIDRRLNGKNKSVVNRQRFIRRYRSAIREAVAEAVSGRSIREIDSGDQISIPAKDISEPVFRHGKGGRREAIHPGNTDFAAGDKIDRPKGGAGDTGSEASNSGEGEDSFAFQLTREEFLDLFFEDLALPDMVKTKLASLDSFKFVRAGHTSAGVPCNINVVRSLRGASARRVALGGPHKRRLQEAKIERRALLAAGPEVDEDTSRKILELDQEIRYLKGRLRALPFIDTFDLRYNHRIKQPRPTSQAVMFCLMDVSGSMDVTRKDIAKRFFILLYMFLRRNYERIDVVFIRHHTSAKEVTEEEFFHSRETGGTIVSSALNLTHDIIVNRYSPADWNIYAAQASDGDNWGDDSPICRDLLLDKIMPAVQYFAYVEITSQAHQSLWTEYEKVAAVHEHFAMRQLEGAQNIFPVFQDLFRKRVE